MTYYIKADGSDTNPGTQTQPYKTFDKAWQVVKPGDKVVPMGEFQLDRTLVLQNKSGTVAAPIVVEGINWTMTRSARYKQPESQELVSFRGNYIHFKKVEFTGFEQRPGEHAYPAFRAHQANYCIFDQINYHKTAAAFSIKGDSNHNLIVHSDFHENQDPYSSSPYDGGDGINIHDCTGTGNVVTGCRAWWNSDDGFDFWNTTGTVEITNCWSFYNGYKPGTFINAGNGTGIKLGGGEGTSPTGQMRICRNNVCYHNGKHGIVQNNHLAALIENNTVVDHSSHSIWTGSWGGPACTVKGNIVWKSGGDQHRKNDRDISTGNSWQGKTVTDADFESMDESQLMAPRQADGSLPALSFLRVKAGSDLVGLGASFGGVVLPPVEPDPTVDVLIHVYTDNTAFTVNKPKKKLRFDIEVLSDGTVRRK